MKEMVIEFVKAYGVTLTLLALSGIFLLGVLKFFRVFEKIEKSKRKYVYTVISVGLSTMASAIYLIIVKQFEVSGFAVLIGAIYALNQIAYSIYENMGIRAGFRKLGSLFISIVAKRQLEEAKLKINETIKQNEEKTVEEADKIV